MSRSRTESSRSRPRPPTRAARALAFPFVALAAACGTPAPPAPPAAPVPSACMPLVAAGPTPESIAVALPAGVAPSDAPAPSTVAERFVYAQLFETLVRVNCDGRVYPGLARSWSRDATGRWVLRLRDDARFWGGDSVTAADVVAAWRLAASSATSRASTALARAMADAATIVDDRTLALSIPEPELTALAEPALAVHRPSPGSSWPEGTGSYRISIEHPPAGGVAELVPASTAQALPRMSVYTGARIDLRDRIDAGADLVITADPAVLGYAAARADLASVPLPWDRSYALLSPRHASDFDSSGAAVVRAALARDAVRGEARGAEPPFWWSGVGECVDSPVADPGAETAPHSVPTRTGGSTRLVYPAADEVARALAERLAALAAMGPPSSAANTPSTSLGALAPELRAGGARTTAVGLAPAEFDAALARGADLAYVVQLPPPTHPFARCALLRAWLATAPWLRGTRADGGAPAGVVPLIDARSRAIVRRGRLSIIVDRDGTVRVAPPAAAAPPAQAAPPSPGSAPSAPPPLR